MTDIQKRIENIYNPPPLWGYERAVSNLVQAAMAYVDADTPETIRVQIDSAANKLLQIELISEFRGVLNQLQFCDEVNQTDVNKAIQTLHDGFEQLSTRASGFSVSELTLFVKQKAAEKGDWPVNE